MAYQLRQRAELLLRPARQRNPFPVGALIGAMRDSVWIVIAASLGQAARSKEIMQRRAYKHQAGLVLRKVDQCALAASAAADHRAHGGGCTHKRGDVIDVRNIEQHRWVLRSAGAPAQARK